MKILTRSIYMLLALFALTLSISACSSDSTTASSETVVGLSTADNTQLLNE
ncbi:MAG: hypothetical protein OEY52_15865 [Gammaproteobacteria bacterium]|nr:hypothetical protein [Gammaproteobacteria bacterium]